MTLEEKTKRYVYLMLQAKEDIELKKKLTDDFAESLSKKEKEIIKVTLDEILAEENDE